MRGKAGTAPLKFPLARITPACAGKRDVVRRTSGLFRDHPRVCGEKRQCQEDGDNVHGSPPRVRGKAMVYFIVSLWSRITPACAGKSQSFSGFQMGRGDHPRVCGEKGMQQALQCTLKGSPPRVRGKDVLHILCDVRRGITPACAGKSNLGYCLRLVPRDHPRVCGEKIQHGNKKQNTKGSPPRVRGKELLSPLHWSTGRITPACAGKSSSAKSPFSAGRDHPRVCGEKLRSLISVFQIGGSPPRVRGKG